MGCNQTGRDSSVYRSDTRPCIVKIDVSLVPHVPPDQRDKFKKEYFSEDYIHKGDPEFEERLEKSTEIMFKRWDWLQKNGSTYVNMLRLSNYNDDNIQKCLNGTMPLCFVSDEIYVEFLSDLKDLKNKLEKATSIKNIRFVQTGSSVPGFSNNPLKGFRDRPSKITDNEKSDVDVVVVGENVKNFIDECEDKGSSIKKYPCVTTEEGGSDMRYALKDWASVKPIKEWIEKWSKKMGGGVQMTLQDGHPIFPPWELPIVL